MRIRIWRVGRAMRLWTRLPVRVLRICCKRWQEDNAGLAMVPVENSVAGRVADIHYLLPSSGLHIVGEHFQPVNHHLLGVKGSRIEQLTAVKSHAQALAQCRQKLRELGLDRIIYPDTAGAAADIAVAGEASMGALASSLAAEIYGLEILQENMEDAARNTTRMLIMARDADYPADDQPPLPLLHVDFSAAFGAGGTLQSPWRLCYQRHQSHQIGKLYASTGILLPCSFILMPKPISIAPNSPSP